MGCLRSPSRNVGALLTFTPRPLEEDYYQAHHARKQLQSRNRTPQVRRTNNLFILAKNEMKHDSTGSTEVHWRFIHSLKLERQTTTHCFLRIHSIVGNLIRSKVDRCSQDSRGKYHCKRQHRVTHKGYQHDQRQAPRERNTSKYRQLSSRNIPNQSIRPEGWPTSPVLSASFPSFDSNESLTNVFAAQTRRKRQVARARGERDGSL